MSDQTKGGLGRGLSALLPRVTVAPAAPRTDANTTDERGAPEDLSVGTTAQPAANPSVASDAATIGVVRELRIDAITPNPKQPRTAFSEEGLEELAASIRQLGVLQPILVRPIDGGFELVAGERRLRASLRAGRDTIPAFVREHADERLLLEALVENIQRVDLDPLDEAAGYRALVDDLGVTHDEVAKRVGKSRAAVTNALRLLTLAPEVQKRIRDGSISAAHARTVASLADAEVQTRAVRRIVADGLSVRATETLVAQMSAADNAALTARSSATRAAHQVAAQTDVPAGVLEAEMLLADHLETSVAVRHARSGASEIVIRYSGVEDLDRIVRRILDHPDATSGDDATSGGH